MDLLCRRGRGWILLKITEFRIHPFQYSISPKFPDLDQSRCIRRACTLASKMFPKAKANAHATSNPTNALNEIDKHKIQQNYSFDISEFNFNSIIKVFSLL